MATFITATTLFSQYQVSVLVTFTFLRQIYDKNNVRQEGFILAHSLWIQSGTEGKSWRQVGSSGCLGPIVSAGRKKRKRMFVPSLLSHFLLHGMVPPTFRMESFPPQPNLENSSILASLLRSLKQSDSFFFFFRCFSF